MACAKAKITDEKLEISGNLLMKKVISISKEGFADSFKISTERWDISLRDAKERNFKKTRFSRNGNIKQVDSVGTYTVCVCVCVCVCERERDRQTEAET